LVAASPGVPVQVVFETVPGAGGQVDQAFHFGDGKVDQAGIGGWDIVGAGRWRRCVVCAGVGGEDGADRQGGHRQYEAALSTENYIYIENEREATLTTPSLTHFSVNEPRPSFIKNTQNG
jgi:hypothetical protein